jgi:hypothetical protein
MDFVNHNPQSAAPAPTQAAPQNHSPKQSAVVRRNSDKPIRIMTVVVLVLGALIVGLLALYLAVGTTPTEQKYVDKTKYQAVFLNGGQVYFGRISELNSKFVTLNKIYYLRVNQQVQPNQTTSNSTAANQDVSLAKLGCELHGPTDVMVVNQSQVLFWENLKDDGQVVKAITAYVKANPNGQKCDATTPTTSTTTPAPSTTTPATTTNR